MNLRAIHIRLIVWYSAMVIVMALAFGAYTYQGVKQRLYDDMGQTLIRRAHEIAENILSHVPPEQAAAISSQIEAVYTPEAIDRFIRITIDDSRILYVSGTPKNGLFDPQDVPKNAPDGASILEVGKQSMQMFVLPDDAMGHHYRIEMGSPTRREDTALHGLVITLLYGLPFTIILVSGGGYLLVRRSLKPVEEIRAIAESITFGNLRNRLPVSVTGDAIEDLSVTLNQMIDRLETSYEQANRFSADASHELRTPLAILRTEMESLVQKLSLHPDDRAIVGILLEETERLSHITENLFTMSRLDAGESRISQEQVDLAQLAESTAEQMRLLADEKSLKWIVNVQRAMVLGDAGRLKQIVVNLLDNAIKYTLNGGTVEIIVEADKLHASLKVKDSGIGIPEDAILHVFERFYRADKARSRSHGGAGLGLSIVKSIVQAHGGTVTIRSEEGKGTVCRVELPLANVKENQA